jgi:hypothetical protein
MELPTFLGDGGKSKFLRIFFFFFWILYLFLLIFADTLCNLSSLTLFNLFAYQKEKIYIHMKFSFCILIVYIEAS